MLVRLFIIVFIVVLLYGLSVGGCVGVICVICACVVYLLFDFYIWIECLIVL